MKGTPPSDLAKARLDVGRVGVAVQQLVDMGCTYIEIVPPPAGGAGTMVRVTTHCGCRLTRTGNDHLSRVIAVAAEAVGEHIQGERKAGLDS